MKPATEADLGSYIRIHIGTVRGKKDNTVWNQELYMTRSLGIIHIGGLMSSINMTVGTKTLLASLGAKVDRAYETALLASTLRESV